MPFLNIDFETRSTSDLRKCGVYKYVEDPNTDLWCMAYAFADEPVQLWVPGMAFPGRVLDVIKDPTWYIRAWNAQFERIVWNTVGVQRYGFPMLPRTEFMCTQADALAMGLPARLDKAAKALRLNIEKDTEGHALMMRMSRPRKRNPLTWWDVPDRKERLYEYCKQDVRVERTVMHHTLRLGESERATYLLDQRINDRGVRLDVTLTNRAKEIAYEGIKRANQSIALATDGDVVAVTQVAKMQHWLREQGCEIPDLKATTLQQYLQSEEGDMHPAVRDVLVSRSEAGKASISKLDKMLEVACSDDRMRGLLQYHGAATGRWAGRLVQPQNFPRGSIKNIEEYVDLIALDSVSYDTLDLHANPLDIVSSMLRSLLTAKNSGHMLMAADFSAIEARVLAWFAGQDDLLKQFADHDRGIGKEVYVIVAEELNSTRQHGKTVILGSGYGMGWQKFQKLAYDAYGIVLTDEEAQYFIKWYRDKYKYIVRFWRDLEDAVLHAVSNPDSVFAVGNKLKFAMRGEHLWCILPSKRPLCYLYPRVKEKVTPWGEMRPAVEVETQDSFTHKWVRRDLYGGLLAENVVQAASRDLMTHAMKQVENAGYPVVLTVHDEIVADVPVSLDMTFDWFLTLMSTPPSWAEGCPVKASGWCGQRYRKG